MIFQRNSESIYLNSSPSCFTDSLLRSFYFCLSLNAMCYKFNFRHVVKYYKTKLPIRANYNCFDCICMPHWFLAYSFHAIDSQIDSHNHPFMYLKTRPKLLYEKNSSTKEFIPIKWLQRSKALLHILNIVYELLFSLWTMKLKEFYLFPFLFLDIFRIRYWTHSVFLFRAKIVFLNRDFVYSLEKWTFTR